MPLTLSSNAILQGRVLEALASASATSVTALAAQLHAPRPSVSRALHALQARDLVSATGRTWKLTDTGRAEVQQIFEVAQAKITAALEQTLTQQRQLQQAAADQFAAAINLSAALPQIEFPALTAVNNMFKFMAEQNNIFEQWAAPILPNFPSLKWLMEPVADFTSVFDNVGAITSAISAKNPVFAALDGLQRQHEALASVTQSMQMLSGVTEALPDIGSTIISLPLTTIPMASPPPVVTLRHRTPTAEEVAEVQWSVVRFTCPICGTTLTLTDKEAQSCTCGKVYRASPVVETLDLDADA